MEPSADIFKNRVVNPEKLLNYGFVKRQGVFVFETPMQTGNFRMTVYVYERGEVETEIVDPAFGEPYTLHLDGEAAGGFVGAVRAEYRQILKNIALNCFESEVFQSACAKLLIDFVRTTFGDELEFLWEKFPDAAVWRRKDTGKWYGALLKVSKRKLGLDSDETAEIIDLKALPEKISLLVDGKKFFPAYHMNKKHWYTVILDGSVSADDICAGIRDSYERSAK